MEVDPAEEPRDEGEAHTSIYDDFQLDFEGFSMAHGMLVEICEEVRDKFPQEERLRFNQLNNLYLAARSGHLIRFVEILNTVSSSAMQTHLVNTVSTQRRGRCGGRFASAGKCVDWFFA